MNKLFKSIASFFQTIYHVFDRILITPISRLIFQIGENLKGNSSKVEKFLNRPNILLYLSLAFAIVFFFLVDSQVVTLVEKEAEILSNQTVSVL